MTLFIGVREGMFGAVGWLTACGGVLSSQVASRPAPEPAPPSRQPRPPEPAISSQHLALGIPRDGDDSDGVLLDHIAKYTPRLLVLDPFVGLHRIDENDAGQVSALLGYLRELQRAHDVAVLVVHHARKNGPVGQPGRSLRALAISSLGPIRFSTSGVIAVSSHYRSSTAVRRRPTR